MASGLESAKLKLDRAAEHVQAVQDAIVRYRGREPGEVVTDANGKQTITFQTVPDPRISILAGEAIYQIRSALDHLAFELVKSNVSNIQLPVNWEKRCEFPLWMEVPQKGNPLVDIPLTYNCFAKTLPGISVAAFTFIESLQPYHRRNGAAYLFLLSQLSNIDKHRHLNLTNTQTFRRETVKFADGETDSTLRRMDAGAEIEPLFPPDIMSKAVHVQQGFQTSVSFHESALGREGAKLPVDYLLEQCFNLAETYIVPAFNKLINESKILG